MGRPKNKHENKLMKHSRKDGFQQQERDKITYLLIYLLTYLLTF